MNRAVVQRAAAGLAAYVRAHGGGSVVIGYDARHKSDVFATDTADVMAGAGLTAYVLPRPLPTPVLAFAIRHLGCAAGVMVTASHNPPQDNGYKVYVGGSQIVAPVDAEISAQIEAVGALADIPRADELDPAGRRGARRLPGPRRLARRPRRRRASSRSPTPRCTGSAATSCSQAFARAGFDAPHVVTEQESPDPDFPTVAFPNPEEPGAIDLAVAAGQSSGADLVLANDPDADRCAVAVPLADGSWRMLRGDEVGALLATHVLAPRPPRHARLLDRLVLAARPDRRRRRPPRTSRRSPASSGSPGCPSSCTATRRRSATASTRRPSATRTA